MVSINYRSKNNDYALIQLTWRRNNDRYTSNHNNCNQNHEVDRGETKRQEKIYKVHKMKIDLQQFSMQANA